MLIHILKKIAILISSLWIVITITFFLVHALPGDPFTPELPLSEEVAAAMRRQHGLDQPVLVQYINYLKNLAQGELGPSMRYEGQTVQGIIASSFPISALLGMQALLIAVTAGISLGIVGTLRRGGWQEKGILLLTTLGISLPSAILAILLQYFFGFKWELLPIACWGSFAQTLLPSLSLAAIPTVSIARFFQSRLVEVLQQDYILIARSKGLSEMRTLIFHAMPNALLAVLTYLGPLIAHILMGSFIVEKVYAIPGLGQWFVSSISNNDYTVTMGLTLFYGALLMFSTFLFDLLQYWLDPRRS